MPAASDLNQITRALSAPLGDLIAAVGRGVAEAQQALDMQTLETFKAMYSASNAAYAELRQLGYQPTWYKIPEVSAEMYVTLSASGEERLRLGGPAALPSERTVQDTAQARGRIQLYATPVDASYSNTYDYNLRASSQIKFRIVPVPPTSQAEGMKVIPDLAGKTYGEAQALLEQLDIPYQVAQDNLEPPDTDLIDRSEPEAGAILPKGQPLNLWIVL